jgi:hypothetical protein
MPTTRLHDIETQSVRPKGYQYEGVKAGLRYYFVEYQSYAMERSDLPSWPSPLPQGEPFGINRNVWCSALSLPFPRFFCHRSIQRFVKKSLAFSDDQNNRVIYRPPPIPSHLHNHQLKVHCIMYGITRALRTSTASPLRQAAVSLFSSTGS